MRMILGGIVGAIVIAIGASYVLRAQDQGRPAWQVYSSSSVRVGDPGENLVGPGWTGEDEVGGTEAPGAGEPAS